MLRTLAAVGALALAGSVGIDPPGSRWLLAVAFGAAIAIGCIVLSAVLNWLTPSERHLDARRRSSYR